MVRRITVRRLSELGIHAPNDSKEIQVRYSNLGSEPAMTISPHSKSISQHDQAIGISCH